MTKAVLIGIAGPSGSGKTSVTARIVKSVKADETVVIQEDSYYRDLSGLPYDKRSAMNFDHPDAFDHDLLAEHLLQLLSGQAVSVPIYDYKLHTRCDETKTVGPAPLVILEGILVFDSAQLRKLMNYRVFVDTPLDISFIRRLKRDMEERGRTVDSVIRQYTETVRPMYFQFVEPSKRHADIVISGEAANSEAVDTLIEKINALLHDGRQ